MGACPSCDGLGVAEFFDPDRVVVHPELSLSAGAVRGWDRRNAYYFQLIASLAKHYKFDVDAVWNTLPAKVRQAVLFGSGDEVISFTYFTDAGGRTTRKHRFEGILPNLERRYRETESPAVREELTKYVSQQPCPACNGTRLNRAARNVFVADRPLPELVVLPVNEALSFFRGLSLPGWRGEIASKIVKEIGERLGFLVDVGLDYLTLERKADTLSGGEAQRIRLASQIGAGLVGVMYVLDEPSIGLHQRDNERLLGTLTRLRDLGNTVIVVEHDEDAIRLADYVLDIGPGAGVHGGEICAQGSLQDILDAPGSLTGQYLSGKRRIEIPKQRHKPNPKMMLHLRGATGNNLKNVDLDIPAGLLTCITGVSGSGKSTLINDTLFSLAANEINGASHPVAAHREVENLDLFDKVVDIDQSPIGRTPRSNPATYTGMFTPLRELFAQVPEARARLFAGSFQLQRTRRPLRGLPGRWPDQGGDALPARRLRALRCLPRQALQPRDAGDPLQGLQHQRRAADDRRGRAAAVRAGAVDRAQAGNPGGCGPELHQAGPERDHAVRRRGATRQVVQGAVAPRYRTHPVHPRRADHRPALPRHRSAARRAAQAARRGQHGGGDRTQSGRDQDRRLDRGSGRKAAIAAAASWSPARRKMWLRTRRPTPGSSWPRCCRR